jgi:hypothetical protein
MLSVCIRCGEEKELPLGRCAACGHLPHRGEAGLSLLASRRMLNERELAEVSARIRRGEPLRPGQLVGLAAITLCFSPLVPLAAAIAWRDTVRGKQALVVGLASAVVLGFALLALYVGPWWGEPAMPA